MGKDEIAEMFANLRAINATFDEEFTTVSGYLRRIPAKQCLDFFRHPDASAWVQANVKAINEKARIPASRGGPKGSAPSHGGPRG